MKGAFLVFISCLALSAPAWAEEPALPAGLGGVPPSSSEPSLPAGLGGGDEPLLPAGLETAQTAEEEEPDPFFTEEDFEERTGWNDALPFDLSGFWEARAGRRLQSDSYEKDASLGETRLQLQADKDFGPFASRVTADFLYDPVLNRHRINLDDGAGWLDLREAWASFSPLDFMDVKAGRQILTWGTGDLVFINDLFPKDWNAFFIGRDVEYLKAPSDALKTSVFSGFANLDVVYTPNFDADRGIDGRRISFYNGNLGRLSGRDFPVIPDRRGNWFAEDEVALRLYRNFEAFETALYYYDGYWKSPAGQTAGGVATYPGLRAVGASIRGPIFQGIGNLETGYYDSKDDPDGNNPLIRNAEYRFLAGYEQEIATELTAGLQYYLERIDSYDAYRATLPTGAFQRDKNRHMITLRLTKRMMDQNLTASLFTFWSPSDDDGYVRPKINYKLNDQWTVEAGGNVFFGDDRRTFFSQFEDNSNAYVSMRYSF
ncbi:MAG: hypothetical protein KDJ15_00075 [Alphaproteobacteria bacterium]|nr:hypothetical protein [Alphaproteobacteria bacterium]